MSGRPVVELAELRPVGFGGYRVDVRSAVHRAALERALALGCNLVDTASGYADGRSEELVGAVLRSSGAPAYVVTKAGYVSPAAAAAMERAGVDVAAIPGVDDDTGYSLAPAVLRAQLALSRSRLGCERLDAVLLHNPERMLETGASGNDLLAALAEAFAVLAEEVEAGGLRHYGVSSNELPAAAQGDPLDLDTLVELERGSGGPGLTFLQFPLNLVERDAARNGDRPSLLARAGGIRTMANRPLNALSRGAKLRLALPPAGEQPGDDPWERCVELVAGRLERLGAEEPWHAFRPMQFLRDSRDEITDPELVDAIWGAQIEPFLAALYDAAPPREAVEAFSRLRASAHASARTKLAERTREALADLNAAGVLEPLDDEPLAVTACRWCLEAGADHVLVGMRRPEYVDQLAPLLRFNAR
ncbi:MAG TPA: aldo/keto reductase [Solirubrobacteraceae bacterium]